MVTLVRLLQVCCLLSAVQADPISRMQPVVDLGYEIYQATVPTNKTAAYHSFPNIRYASAPVGDLRWKAPVPPQTNRSVIQSNTQSIECSQGSASWQIHTSKYISNYLKTGNIPNVTYSDLSTFVSGGVEDCLFLDVMAPRKVFQSALANGTLAPVLVWIHGGGFTAGSKSSIGSALGLISRSQMNGSGGVIYVALNYRLGAFGFMSGPVFEEQGGLPNAGLHDQRLALEWIQQHIHKFGGDKNRVTVFGGSAGGGSIMHHITAFGGSAPSLFSRAIPQSPGYFPYRSKRRQDNTLRSFLAEANITTLNEARKISTDVLITANANSIGQSQPYVSSIYGPTIDGTFVQEDPKVSLRVGKFDESVKLIISHNSNEGLVLVPAVHTSEEYVTLVRNILTRANDTTIDYVTNILYPPAFDGSMGYADNYQRAAKTAGDIIINCNAASLSSAYKKDSYGYYFDVYPGLHGQDISYTFYNPHETATSPTLVETGSANQTIAFSIQDYIMSLAKSGTPESSFDGLSSVPTLGLGAMTVSLNSSDIKLIHNPAFNDRCQWLALDLYG